MQRPDRIGWTVHVSSPSGVKTVLNKPGWLQSSYQYDILSKFCLILDIFPKAPHGIGSEGTMFNKFIGGSNVLLSDGEEYKRHRKVRELVYLETCLIYICLY